MSHPIVVSVAHPGIVHYCDGGGTGCFRTKYQRCEGDRLPACGTGGLPLRIGPAAFGAHQQRDAVGTGADRGQKAPQGRRLGFVEEVTVVRRFGETALEADGGRISGMRRRRDCWLLSRAIRTQRSMRFRAASASPFSLRTASTGRIRSTPSSVAFSIIHSKRSNLKRAAQRVMGTGGGGRVERLRGRETRRGRRGLRRFQQGKRSGCRRSRSAARLRHGARESDGALHPRPGSPCRLESNPQRIAVWPSAATPAAASPRALRLPRCEPVRPPACRAVSCLWLRLIRT